jgi:hypothetical protein
VTLLVVFAPCVYADLNTAQSDISSAKQRMVVCTEALKQAEASGANVTVFAAVLDDAGSLLSKAELAFSVGDYGSASSLIAQSQGVLVNFVGDAHSLRDTVSAQRTYDFFVFQAGSFVGALVVLLVGAVLWVLAKRKAKSGGSNLGSLYSHKSLLIVVVAVLSLLIASPGLQRIVLLPQTEFFTGLSVLDSNRTAYTYPSNLTAAQNCQIFLGINNHLGSGAYYKVEVKFRNQTQSNADILGFTPSLQPSLFNLYVFVADKGSWELPVNFSLAYSYSQESNDVVLSSLVLNGNPLNLYGSLARVDPSDGSCVCNLLFELWTYNNAVSNFQYEGQFVSLRLNLRV